MLLFIAKNQIYVSQRFIIQYLLFGSDDYTFEFVCKIIPLRRFTIDYICSADNNLCLSNANFFMHARERETII